MGQASNPNTASKSLEETQGSLNEGGQSREDQWVAEDEVVRFTKTVGESDVYLFAGITGDFYPIHVDSEYAARTPVGERVAHGVLVMGLMSAVAARWATQKGLDVLSYGYDNVRFIRPVKIGDTITVSYGEVAQDNAGQKRIAKVEAHNQNREIVAVAEHILWIIE